MARRLNQADPHFEAAFALLLDDKRETAQDVNDAVFAILGDVRRRGDDALLDYTRRFDRSFGDPRHPGHHRRRDRAGG